MTEQSQGAAPLVLLLSDEPILRMILSDYIEEAGCETIETHSAAEAIRLLETRPEIRIVVADLDVRGTLMGMKLAALIRDRWPPIELMLTGALRPDSGALPARGYFFQKPFRQQIFIEALRDFSAGRTPRPFR